MCRAVLVLLGAAATLLLAGCGSGTTATLDPAAMTLPAVGVCHSIDRGALDARSNDAPATPCTDPHDDETFASGMLPDTFADASYTDPALDAWAYGACHDAFAPYLGTDDSTAMRSMLTWVWFRPSEAAWSAGARWYRCDIVGGVQSESLLDLPSSAKGLLRGTPGDQWLACGRGSSVATSIKVPCTSKHDWRAVTTIKLGEAGDPYPGDADVQAKTKSYCSDSVDAWLGYPADFDYGYTWFDEAQWDAGNRRSICWAWTAK